MSVYHLVSGTAVPTLGLFARALVGSVVLQVVLLAAVQKERGIVEVLRKKAVHLTSECVSNQFVLRESKAQKRL